MSWSEQVFRYCERGLDGSFWAEPANALSNIGFLVAASVAARHVAGLSGTAVVPAGAGPGAPPDAANGAPGPAVSGGDRLLLWALVALVAAIGIGSFLFHTYATRWARLADVGPIAVFMLVYLAAALRLFLGCKALLVTLGIALFLAANWLVARVACPGRAAAITDIGRDPCLNGTMAYLPALAALGVVGGLLVRRHPAGSRLLLAAGLFLASMLLRWVDMRWCASTLLLGRYRGTHALWHLLNALTLHVLLGAAIDAVRSKR